MSFFRWISQLRPVATSTPPPPNQPEIPPDKSIVCIHCYRLNPPAATFCGHCGVPVGFTVESLSVITDPDKVDRAARNFLLHTAQRVQWGSVFTRVLKHVTHEQRMNGWDAPSGDSYRFPEYWQYKCPDCGGDLTPGPSGGGTNQVCEKCNINYGCLPGALER
jgi:ribosomal protein L40E